MEDGELSEDGWKKVSTITKEAFKLIGKAVGTKVKLIPIVGTLVGYLMDARAMQEAEQELFEKSTAAKKWHYIEVGLSRYRYDAITPKTWQSFHDDRTAELEEDQDSSLWKTQKRKEEIETWATDHADSSMKSLYRDFIEDLSTAGEKEGEACYFFYRAHLTKVELKKPWWKILSYDPERVEIEDPLMHGEPYPEII
jgi:hypothetical protein